MSNAAKPVQRRPSLKKRILIPATLAALLVLVLLAAIVRGTWADTLARNPSEPSEGVVRQLLLTPEGTKIVRCAQVLDHPLDTVWTTVTDYELFTEIFPTLRSSHVESTKDGIVRLTGEALAFNSIWPFEIEIRHEVTPEKRIASWDGVPERNGKVQRLHGSWTLTPAGPNRTLLVYASEIEVRGYPNWFVRNVLLTRQPTVLRAVSDWLERKEAE